MKRPLLRWAPRLLGLGLVGVVLSLVGWGDRVRDVDGREWTGSLVRHGPGFVVLERDGEEAGIEIDPARGGAVRVGLRTTFGRLTGSPGALLLGVTLHLACLLLGALRWRVLLRGAGLETTTAQVLRLSWLGLFMANILPGIAGGDLVRAVYAGHSHPEGRARAALSVVADRLIGLLMLLCLAAGVLFVVPARLLTPAQRWTLLGAAAGLGALLAAAIAFGAGRPVEGADSSGRPRLRGLLAERAAALAHYARCPGVCLVAGLLSLAGHLGLLAALWSYGRALGVDLSLLAIGVGVPAAQAVSAVPLLPGGWGLGESAYYVILGRAGVAGGTAVALSVSYRVIQTLLSLPGGLFLRAGRAKTS
ncbi:MAG: lysylphosphatidylglycerol synthase transmembrane domain-containing protein [Planctomycetota bacterium]